MLVIIYIIIGFVAQMVDGMLGMAYGVSCRTFLKTFAHVPANIVSAVVHYAEIPTSFISMISHIKFKNVNKNLFVNLAIPGIIGSIIGAYIITLNLNYIELIIDIYLIITGILILNKGFTSHKKEKKLNNKLYIIFLGFFGAFFDASGGGGWGPIVTGSLLSNSDKPAEIIGTVNSSEFLVTITSSITFILLLTNIKKYLLIIVGLIIGGVIAAPIAAKICKKIPEKKLYLLVGSLLILLNVYNVIDILL